MCPSWASWKHSGVCAQVSMSGCVHVPRRGPESANSSTSKHRELEKTLKIKDAFLWDNGPDQQNPACVQAADQILVDAGHNSRLGKLDKHIPPGKGGDVMHHSVR